jgi:superfamily II DNA or RNA helicase
MPKRTSTTGSELFIVDNSDEDWKVQRYLHDWCQLSQSIDIATGYFEIGSLLALKDEWQKVDQIRILMGDEVSLRTKKAFADGLTKALGRLDGSLEAEKLKNDFLEGVPAVVQAIRSGKIQCKVYRKDKFHAKAYITHARMEVVGSSALVGSSNFTFPGLMENIELNVQVTGSPVKVLQEWYEEHWNQAEDVTPEILRSIERHTRDYLPFEVYAKALHEFFRTHEVTDEEWLKHESSIYPVLDQYQRDGFHELLGISSKYRGAFLCDGVGLGKTFIGLMLIEYLVERKRQRVALFVPKAARKSVWEAKLARYLPHLSGEFSNLVIYNHTDLLRKGDYPARLERIRTMADVFIVDEAHHFRNPGVQGEEGERKSHYWQLYDLCGGKDLYLLTATPVNNRLLDLQHMMELFSRREPDYFKAAPLGIHSLPGHFRKMEKDLEALLGNAGAENGATVVDQVDAQRVLLSDDLFRALVVQRSRAYVVRSQQQYGGTQTLFPEREDPKVASYELKKTYGRLLDVIERAFNKEKPLFSLAIYYPLAYYTGPETPEKKWERGRQREVVSLIRILFLKRFESSAQAFQLSCEDLLTRLLAWVTKHSQTPTEKKRLERWRGQNEETLLHAHDHQHQFLDEDADEDLVSPEMLEEIEELPRSEYKVDEILDETFLDMDEIVRFLGELHKFRPSHDDKLKALIRLLKTDPVLKNHKVLIFTEFMATARYLKAQLEAAGIEGVDEVDSTSKRDRGEIITQFAPYYNESSSDELAKEGLAETRVLISTDVLSEGLNLQDATRLINYDLHWNPVRLMQRIGRIDRRMDLQTEMRIVTHHPEQKPIRGKVAYWNFLPPDELDGLLKLYSRVAHKTLRISKTFGIEGKKLLTPDDDYEALKDFTRSYEGNPTPEEDLHLEYQRLIQKNPDLEKSLSALPGKVFSGKEHPSRGSKGVFFCYAMPAPPGPGQEGTGEAPEEWTEEAGDTKWYLYDVAEGHIAEDPSQIVAIIRSTPETPRHCVIERPTLTEIRQNVEKHIKNTYLKKVQAPIGVKPKLKAWMELN